MCRLRYNFKRQITNYSSQRHADSLRLFYIRCIFPHGKQNECLRSFLSRKDKHIYEVRLFSSSSPMLWWLVLWQYNKVIHYPTAVAIWRACCDIRVQRTETYSHSGVPPTMPLTYHHTQGKGSISHCLMT